LGTRKLSSVFCFLDCCEEEVVLPASLSCAAASEEARVRVSLEVSRGERDLTDFICGTRVSWRKWCGCVEGGVSGGSEWEEREETLECERLVPLRRDMVL